MAKVIFEFDDVEDRDEVNFIVNRYKIINALYELSTFRRNLYKGYEDSDTVVIKDNRVVYRDGKKLEDYDLKGTKLYIHDDKVINRLDDILDEVRILLN